MRISGMGTVIPLLLILLSKTIINYGETRRVCPPEMSIDDGNEGRQYCRPKICNGNKCVEEQDNVTCQTVTGNRESCSMIINWTLQSKTADIISCVINQGEMKYVDSITVARKCFSRGSNSYSKIMKKDCTNVERCDLNFSHCHSDKKSQPQLETIIACEARSSVNLQNKTKEINLSEKIKVAISKNHSTLREDEKVTAGEILDCKIEIDEFMPVRSVTVSLTCERFLVLRKICKTKHCSFKIIGLLQFSNKCSIKCVASFKGAFNNNSILGSPKTNLDVIVQGVNDVNLDFNDGNLKNNDIIRIDSPITCEVKSSHNLQNIAAKIIINQFCNNDVINRLQCAKRMKCTIYAKPCRDNEFMDVMCEDKFTATRNYEVVQNLTVHWPMKKIFLNHEGYTINQEDALTVSKSVTCQIEDNHNLVTVVTVKQICKFNINESQQCSNQPKCTLLLRGTIGTIKCGLECSVLINERYSKILLQNRALLYQVRVEYPDATSPMIEFQETVLHNNDVIHVNDTLLKCSVKLLNETTPRYISRTKIHLKVTIQCSSIVKSIECASIYSCNASIALCQFLDRVHVTCAEYYSEKINRILLHRRIDGSWGQWLPWTAWNPPCGKNSTRLKTRQCDSPYPKNGGNRCIGSKVVKEKKKSENCSDGAHAAVWGTWSDWSPCSLSCNTGITVRRRLCLSTKPASPDKFCVGSSEIREFCFIISCAEHRKQVSMRWIVSILLGVGSTIAISFLIYIAYFCLFKKKSKTEVVNSDEVIEAELMYSPTFE